MHIGVLAQRREDVLVPGAEGQALHRTVAHGSPAGAGEPRHRPPGGGPPRRGPPDRRPRASWPSEPRPQAGVERRPVADPRFVIGGQRREHGHRGEPVAAERRSHRRQASLASRNAAVSGSAGFPAAAWRTAAETGRQQRAQLLRVGRVGSRPRPSAASGPHPGRRGESAGAVPGDGAARWPAPAGRRPCASRRARAAAPACCAPLRRGLPCRGRRPVPPSRALAAAGLPARNSRAM